MNQFNKINLQLHIIGLHLSRLTLDKEWNESKHPRGPDGKFGKGDSSSTKMEKNVNVKASPNGANPFSVIRKFIRCSSLDDGIKYHLKQKKGDIGRDGREPQISTMPLLWERYGYSRPWIWHLCYLQLGRWRFAVWKPWLSWRSQFDVAKRSP